MNKTLEVGDIVRYKKQGRYGSYEAKVLAIGKRIKIHILNWCGTKVKENWIVFVSKRSLR